MSKKHIRTAVFYPALLLLLVVSAYAYVFDAKLDLQGDNVRYYLLGKALYLGKGYIDLSAADQASAVKYPPGYPALIALVMTLTSDDFVVVKIANGVFLTVSVLLLYYLFNTLGGSVHLAFVAAVFTLANGHLLRTSTTIMSEIPFLLFTTLTLVFFIRVDTSAGLKSTLRNPYTYLLLACFAYAFYLRSAGISLWGGIGLFLLLRKNWRLLLIAASAYAVCLAPWILRGDKMGGSNYMNEFFMVNPYRPELGTIGPLDYLARLTTNAERYILSEIPYGCFSFLNLQMNFVETAKAFHYLSAFAFFALVVFGVYKIRRQRLLIVDYLLGTTAILLSWPPAWHGTRFILPIVPLLLFSFFNGLNEVLAWSNQQKELYRPLLYLPFVLFTIPSIESQHAVALLDYPPSWAHYFETARWVAQNTDKNALISCRKPALFHMYAKRHTTSYLFTPDDKEFMADLERRQVDYLVLDALEFSSTKLYQYPAIDKNRDRFQAIFKSDNPPTYLFKFLPTTP